MMRNAAVWKYAITAALIAAAVLVVFVEGPLNPFWVWNAAPLGLAGLALWRGSGRIRAVAPVFALVVMVPIVYIHLAWLMDWDRIKTGSSTSGLIFIFLPIYAAILGAVFALIAGLAMALFARLANRSK